MADKANGAGDVVMGVAIIVMLSMLVGVLCWWLLDWGGWAVTGISFGIVWLIVVVLGTAASNSPPHDTTNAQLFTPGDGGVPPMLSGRQEQQARLSEYLACLKDGKPPPHNVVLVGPRGNGKTVLLHWFKRECEEGAAVNVTMLTPDDMPDTHALAATLVPRSWSSFIPRKVVVAGTGFELQPQVNTQPQQLARGLIRRCSAKPFALLLDEAHTLDVAVGRAVLNASQQVRAKKAPFLLVLAGTPGLPSHLAKMDATFWNRLGTGRLGVGRLTKEAAGLALRNPLESRGGKVDEDALDAVVEECQCYPYFVQLWGGAVCQASSTSGPADLTMDVVAAVRTEVSKQVNDYYRDRYRELEQAGLLPAAAAVASVFEGEVDEGVTDGDIERALASILAEEGERLAAREALHECGYIWSPPGQEPGQEAWHAGIPSLMSHVRRRFALARA